MRKLLTIGETADLLHLSTSQIRFYEKEGLLHPARVETSGYRLYDFDQTSTLEMIIMLRKLGMPLKEIREFLKKENRNDHDKVFSDSLAAINKEIRELDTKRRQIEKMQLLFNSIETTGYKVEEIPSRTVIILDDINEPDGTIKSVYDFTQTHSFDYMDYNVEIFMIYGTKGSRKFCLFNTLETQRFPDLNSLTIDKGRYLIRTALIHSYDEVPDLLKKCKSEAIRRGLSPQEEMISIENQKTLLYSRRKFFVTLQVRIKP